MPLSPGYEPVMVHGPELPFHPIEGLDSLSAGVFVAFRRAFRLQRRLAARAFAEKGIHPNEAICMRVLAERTGMSQRDLADLLHLSRPRITAILQTLEKSGAVTRRSDEDDQRVTRVYLTEYGRRLSSELHQVFAECLGKTIGALTEEDRGELIRLLDAIAENTSCMLGETEPGAGGGEGCCDTGDARTS